MNPLLRPKTIKTILESAPLVIQGAGKLIQMMKDRESGHTALAQEGKQRDPDKPLTMDDLREEIDRLDTRLKENSDSDMEQIRLIEELARQNEAMAESIARNNSRLSILTILAALALVVALLSMLLSAA